jgi:hypothetical protein
MNFIRKAWEEYWKTKDGFSPEDGDTSCRACAHCYQSGENVTWNGYEYENWDSGLKCDFRRRVMGEYDDRNSPFCSVERSVNGDCGIEGKNFLRISYRESKIPWFYKFGCWNFTSTRYLASKTPGEPSTDP